MSRTPACACAYDTHVSGQISVRTCLSAWAAHFSHAARPLCYQSGTVTALLRQLESAGLHLFPHLALPISLLPISLYLLSAAVSVSQLLSLKCCVSIAISQMLCLSC